MADMYPHATVAPRSPSVRVMVTALLAAAVLGAGLMFAGWVLLGTEDEVVVPQARTPATTAPHVTTRAEIAAARALDRAKDEAATAAAIGNGAGITDKRAAAPTGSLAGTTSPVAKTDAAMHAKTIRATAAARAHCVDAVLGHC